MLTTLLENALIELSLSSFRLKTFVATLPLLFGSLAFSTPASADPLYVGFSASDITPKEPLPLAGYGSPNRRLIPWDVFNRYPYSRYFKPSEGVLDPIRVKVMYLQKGGKQLLFVSLDLIGADLSLRRDILKKITHLGFNERNFFLGATHTHSGPGTLSRNDVWEFLVMDRFRLKIYKRLLRQVVVEIENAMSQIEPANLYSLSFQAKGLQKNRSIKNGKVDRSAHLLMARSTTSHTWLGALVNFAIHGTALQSENLKFSADVTGSIERELEKKMGDQAIAVFFNGAEGDVAPRKRNKKAMKQIGVSFAEQAWKNRHRMKVVDPQWSIKTRLFRLGKAKLSLGACAGKGLFIFGPRPLAVSIKKSFPRTARLWTLRLGHINFLTWPGEPTTQVGFNLKKLARKKLGEGENWILGLTNGYLAYFTTKKEFKSGSYEACSTLYGPESERRMLRAYGQLFDRF